MSFIPNLSSIPNLGCNLAQGVHKRFTGPRVLSDYECEWGQRGAFLGFLQWADRPLHQGPVNPTNGALAASIPCCSDKRSKTVCFLYRLYLV